MSGGGRDGAVLAWFLLCDVCLSLHLIFLVLILKSYIYLKQIFSEDAENWEYRIFCLFPK